MVRLEQVSKSYNIALPPYDAVLLLSPRAARRSELAAALTPILGKITDDTMRQANKMVDLQGRSVPEAAAFVQKAQIQSEIRVR
jgi:glycine betaine/choline ABC-type transport system substrate-binding protein